MNLVIVGRKRPVLASLKLSTPSVGVSTEYGLPHPYSRINIARRVGSVMIDSICELLVRCNATLGTDSPAGVQFGFGMVVNGDDTLQNCVGGGVIGRRGQSVPETASPVLYTPPSCHIRTGPTGGGGETDRYKPGCCCAGRHQYS